MATHVSEAEAIVNMAGLLARVDAGEEIVIERHSGRLAVLKPAGEPRPEVESESVIATAERSQGPEVLPFVDEFAADMDEIVAMRALSAKAWPMARSLAECIAAAKHHEHEAGRVPFSGLRVCG